MTIEPKPVKPRLGQESVWDYPRPPRLERFVGSITVELGGKTIASTTRAWRVLETSHPPTYYLPRDAFFAEGVLRETSGSSWCEWEGPEVSYYDLVTETRVAPKAAWSYLNPSPGFKPIAGVVAVMPAQVDRCTHVQDRKLITLTGYGLTYKDLMRALESINQARSPERRISVLNFYIHAAPDREETYDHHLAAQPGRELRQDPGEDAVEGLALTGTVNLRWCGRSANHISLIRHTRPGESRRLTRENRPLGLLKLTVPLTVLASAYAVCSCRNRLSRSRQKSHRRIWRANGNVV